MIFFSSCISGDCDLCGFRNASRRMCAQSFLRSQSTTRPLPHARQHMHPKQHPRPATTKHASTTTHPSPSSHIANTHVPTNTCFAPIPTPTPPAQGHPSPPFDPYHIAFDLGPQCTLLATAPVAEFIAMPAVDLLYCRCDCAYRLGQTRAMLQQGGQEAHARGHILHRNAIERVLRDLHREQCGVLG